MTSQRLQFGQGFWVWWVALILVGVVMQYLLAGAAAKEQLGFFGGTAVVGALRWRVIRGQAFPSRWQVLACMGAYAVGFAAGHALLHAIVGPAGGYVVFWAAVAIVSAVITGITLLLLLRQRFPASSENCR